MRFPLRKMSNTRALLVLGRVSNLSTVWSNCLCAWILGGGGDWFVFLSLLVGSSLMYVGGMYLNDYCDVDFDKQFRPERPIPSGQISRRSVLVATVGLLLGGYAGIIWINIGAALGGLLLLVLIVVYNLVHKKTSLGIPLMAGCRSAVFLTVGASSFGGLDVDVVWASGFMFLYVIGITGLARSESTDGSLSKAGLFGIIAPLSGSFIFGLFNGLWTGALAGLIVAGGWIGFSFWHASSGGRLVIGRTIGPLLAGICLVDWAILSSMRQFSLTVGGTLMAFFIVAIIAQRRIPAT